MFAPEGYLPLRAILADAMFDSLFEEAAHCLCQTANSVLSFTLTRRDDLILKWVLGYFEKHLFLSAIGGRPISFDGMSVFRQRFFVDIMDHKFPEGFEHPQVDKIRTNFNLCEPLSWSEIDCYGQLANQLDKAKSDSDAKQISLNMAKKIEAQADTDGFTKAPIFYNSARGKIDLTFYRYLGRVDKRDSHEGFGVIQAGICHGDQLAPTSDERRRMVAV